MPYVVTRSCCADASCVLACPVNCIHPAPGEPGFAEAEMVYVDPRACVNRRTIFRTRINAYWSLGSAAWIGDI